MQVLDTYWYGRIQWWVTKIRGSSNILYIDYDPETSLILEAWNGIHNWLVEDEVLPHAGYARTILEKYHTDNRRDQ